MNQQIFAIWDAAVHRYMEPFSAPTIEFAIREFRRAVNKPDHQFNTYPADYTLFHVGEFNPLDGTLIPSGTPTNLGVAITFLEQTVIDLNDRDDIEHLRHAQKEATQDG